MAAKKMQDLMVEELRDIYHAEKQLIRALPKMQKAASAESLKQAFEQHLEETRHQVERLEQIFEELDMRTRGRRCEAMEGLVEEAQEMMEEGLAPEVLDAALVAAAQKVEHYEIASYGTLRAYAEALGHEKITQLLDQTLEEEKATDQRLNQLALSEINKRAIGESEAA